MFRHLTSLRTPLLQISKSSPIDANLACLCALIQIQYNEQVQYVFGSRGH